MELVAAAGRPFRSRRVRADAQPGQLDGRTVSPAPSVRADHRVRRCPGLPPRPGPETVYALLAGNLARQLHAHLAEYHLSVLGEPLVAASTPGGREDGRPCQCPDPGLGGGNPGQHQCRGRGGLTTLAFGTVRPVPEWLEVSRRCLSVLCRAQHAARRSPSPTRILARVDDADLAAQVETEAARTLWLSGRVHGLISRIEKTLRGATWTRQSPCRCARRTRWPAPGRYPGERCGRRTAGAVEQARDSGDREALTLAVQAAGEAAP